MANDVAPPLNGGTHINLTVRDLDRSTEWYCRALGFTVVRDARPVESGFTFRTLLHSRALTSIVLGQGDRPVAEPFDERRVGLHHLAFHVPEREDLHTWVAHLDSVGVEHGGVQELFLEAGHGVWLRDPDNIWLELYWLNADYFMQRMREHHRARRAERVGGQQ
ncbi:MULTISPECIES: VOC family protein [Micromonospora]|uniref:Glyoxalase/Bleomycin resistance protein/Dioxygenase superfamily protein n=1 Tax=Micromonospora rifamycinica TaxID=291594 RepID=A0A109IJ64_9ACTN|nr:MULTISPECIES: VOC family protein [Micromonospora]KWV31478.1 glyoxalase [Micromonospora rifamycinica]WFE65101.1 VOC family protein [Micromonospora sp. WMMD714]SCG48490.1 Glyoxalase/Bleomycin resistance protein/Dioxygenase superfamily protein [Micromonospora rifamycinica]